MDGVRDGPDDGDAAGDVDRSMGIGQVSEVEREARRLLMVDFHPPCWLLPDTCRELWADEGTGSADEEAEEEGKPNPRALVKKEVFPGARSLAGGVTTGSGKSPDRSAGGGGMGDNE